MRPRVVVTHWVHPEVIALLERECEVISNPTREMLPRDEVLRRCASAQGVMVFMPDLVDESFLTAAPNLKVVAAALKGYDNCDVEACTRRGIWFTSVPDLLTVPTAELTIALLLGLGRNILQGDRLVRSGSFAGWRPILYGTGLAGKTVGLVGFGAVGRAVARRLASFEATLIYYDPSPENSSLTNVSSTPEKNAEQVELLELLGRSDFVVLMAPLTKQSFHLIDRESIAKLKPGSYLINTGRGSVVDEDAVAEELETGHLAGYAADVFAMEDWARPDRPQGIPQTLLNDASRTLFTPHLGSAIDEARLEIAISAANDLLQALRGEMPCGAVNRLKLSSN